MSRRVVSIPLMGLAFLVFAAAGSAQDAPQDAPQGAAEPPPPEPLATEPSPTPAPCPQATFRPQLLTPPALRIPRDASLVVGLFDGGTLTDLPAVTLERRRRSTALIREAIAPGLYRLRPDARRIWGQWNLTGVPGAPQILFGRPGIGAAPVRPSVVRVERYLVASGTTTRMEVRAHFHFPIPPSVVALVLYWGDDAQPDGFARVTPGTQEAVLHVQTGHCSRLIAGATAPPETGNIRVAFVGRYGQVSEISEPSRLGQ